MININQNQHSQPHQQHFTPFEYQRTSQPMVVNPQQFWQQQHNNWGQLQQCTEVQQALQIPSSRHMQTMAQPMMHYIYENDKNPPNHHHQTINYMIQGPSIQNQQQQQQMGNSHISTQSSLNRQHQSTPNFAAMTTTSLSSCRHTKQSQQQRCLRTNSSQASSYSNHRRQTQNGAAPPQIKQRFIAPVQQQQQQKQRSQDLIPITSANTANSGRGCNSYAMAQSIMAGAAPPRPAPSQNQHLQNQTQPPLSTKSKKNQMIQQAAVGNQFKFNPTPSLQLPQQQILSNPTPQHQNQSLQTKFTQSNFNPVYHYDRQSKQTDNVLSQHLGQQFQRSEPIQVESSKIPTNQSKSRQKSLGDACFVTQQHQKRHSISKHSLGSVEAKNSPLPQSVKPQPESLQAKFMPSAKNQNSAATHQQKNIEKQQQKKQRQRQHTNNSKFDSKQMVRGSSGQINTGPSYSRSGGTTQQSTKRQNQTQAGALHQSRGGHSTSVSCHRNRNLDAKGFLEDTISSSFFLIQNQQTQKKSHQQQPPQQSKDRPSSKDPCVAIQQQVRQQQRQVVDVLRDILSESNEELVWRYTNVTSKQPQQHQRFNSQPKLKKGKLGQRTMPSKTYRDTSDTTLCPAQSNTIDYTSQENTLKDSLGQSNSQHLKTYFQTAANEISLEQQHSVGSIPQSQVTTFENYRRVQNVRSITQHPNEVNFLQHSHPIKRTLVVTGPSVADENNTITTTVATATNKALHGKNRLSQMMDQRSFGSMQTLGRGINNSTEQLPSASNISMQVEHCTMPAANDSVLERKQVTQRPSPRYGSQIMGQNTLHRRSRSYISTDELSQLSQMYLHQRCPSGHYGSSTSVAPKQPVPTTQTNSRAPSQNNVVVTESQPNLQQYPPPIKAKNDLKPYTDLSVIATAATNTRLQTPMSQQCPQLTQRLAAPEPSHVRNPSAYSIKTHSPLEKQPAPAQAPPPPPSKPKSQSKSREQPHKRRTLSVHEYQTTDLGHKKNYRDPRRNSTTTVQQTSSLQNELQKVLSQVEHQKKSELERSSQVRQQLLAEILNQKRHQMQQHPVGIVQQQTEIVHQNLCSARVDQTKNDARNKSQEGRYALSSQIGGVQGMMAAAKRRPEQSTILNEISEKDDFKTIANSDGEVEDEFQASKKAQRGTVQHTLTPTHCPDSDLKKAIQEQQIYPECEVIIKGRNLLDINQRDHLPQRDSIESKTALYLNMMTQQTQNDNPEEKPQQALLPQKMNTSGQQTQPNGYQLQFKKQFSAQQLMPYQGQSTPQYTQQTYQQFQEETASCQMNNLTLSNLTNVNPLLFTHPEGGGSSSNQNGRRLGTMQDYADGSPSKILLSNQSSSTLHQQTTQQQVNLMRSKLAASFKNSRNAAVISSPKLLKSSEVMAPMQRQSNSTSSLLPGGVVVSNNSNSDSKGVGPDRGCSSSTMPGLVATAPLQQRGTLQHSSSGLSQQYASHQHSVVLTEPSLPTGMGLHKQKTLDMDQLIRSFLREQNEGQQQVNNNSRGGTSTHQSEQAIPISSIIDAYHSQNPVGDETLIESGRYDCR